MRILRVLQWLKLPTRGSQLQLVGQKQLSVGVVSGFVHFVDRQRIYHTNLPDEEDWVELGSGVLLLSIEGKLKKVGKALLDIIWTIGGGATLFPWSSNSLVCVGDDMRVKEVLPLEHVSPPARGKGKAIFALGLVTTRCSEGGKVLWTCIPDVFCIVWGDLQMYALRSQLVCERVQSLVDSNMSVHRGVFVTSSSAMLKRLSSMVALLPSV